MPDIMIAASITTALALALIGGILLKGADKEELPVLAAVALLALPMNPAAYNFVRLPLDAHMKVWFFSDPGLYRFLTTFYAPLTEEPAKLWMLLIPWIYNRINGKNFWKFALAIGLGFGIGEAWLIAGFLRESGLVGQYRWYQLGGYMSERLMVCAFHAAFTSLSLFALRRFFVLGLAGSMFLHWLGNFPIYLARRDLWHLGQGFWQPALGYWIIVYFIAMVIMYVMLANRTTSVLGAVRLIYGKAKCPECGLVYDRPILAINLGPKRYERCPGCRKFHFTGSHKE